MGSNGNYMVVAYLVYLVCSIGLTVWVARTLSKNGAVFLVETFAGKEALAESVNHLLVVGFYLVNIGFVTLALRESTTVDDVRGVVELTSTKLGRVLLALGGMHFFNLYVFHRIRRGALLRTAPPPVAPGEFLAGARGYRG